MGQRRAEGLQRAVSEAFVSRFRLKKQKAEKLCFSVFLLFIFYKYNILHQIPIHRENCKQGFDNVESL